VIFPARQVKGFDFGGRGQSQEDGCARSDLGSAH
jgi:hypothetical protein